jgi:phosphoribosylglycinamide formyltransferase 1
VLEQEHRIFPQAIRWFLEDRLSIESGRVRISGDCRYPAAAVSPEPA